MQNFSKKIALAMTIAVFAMPMIASAQTTDVQSQIQALLTQIKALQEQIKNLVASSTANGTMPPGQIGKMACITLNRSLHQGDQGDDVKNIQEMLAQDPDSDFHGSATGFFGPLTARAMMMFQMHNSIASSTDGSVGPLTRVFFDRRCGKGEGKNNDMQAKMPPGAAMNQAWAAGSITANSTTSITIRTDGGSVIANISASTTIHVFAGNSTSTPPTNGSVSDLVVGKMARAVGLKNADGSIQAMLIDVGTTLPPLAMMKDDGHGGGKPPVGMMPIMNGQNGDNRGPGGGPQNW